MLLNIWNRIVWRFKCSILANHKKNQFLYMKYMDFRTYILTHNKLYIMACLHLPVKWVPPLNYCRRPPFVKGVFTETIHPPFEIYAIMHPPIETYQTHPLNIICTCTHLLNICTHLLNKCTHSLNMFTHTLNIFTGRFNTSTHWIYAPTH